MNSPRIQDLIRRRDELVTLAEQLVATPESERPSKAADRKAWDRELKGIQGLIDQINALVERSVPKPRVAVPDLVSVRDPETGEGITVARMRKGRHAEIRVTIKPWQGRRVIDVRLWSHIAGQGDEMKPSRKGIAFDASKLDALIDALHQAKQHV